MGRNTVSQRSESKSPGGCNGSSGGQYAMIDRMMMLRFRPIAPKPVIAGIETTVAVDRSSDVSGMKNLVIYNERRPKKKYDKTGNRSSMETKKKKKKEGELQRNYMSDQTGGQMTAAETPSPLLYFSREGDDPSIFNSRNNIDTVFGSKIGHLPSYFQKFLLMGSSTGMDPPLLQSSSEHDEARPAKQCFRYPESYDDVTTSPYSLSLFTNIPDATDGGVACRAVDTYSRVVVVVETVLNNISSDVEVDALELGRTDLAKMKTLEEDKLPGFISDSSNKVIWVNRAFEAMICVGGSKETAVDPSSAAPELVVKDQHELPQTCRTFSCHVKLHRHGKLRGGGAEEKYDTIPCDVWRMDSKGFAWRLDVQTALTLGCYSRD